MNTETGEIKAVPIQGDPDLVELQEVEVQPLQMLPPVERPAALAKMRGQTLEGIRQIKNKGKRRRAEKIARASRQRQRKS